jgi:hypothetical protein
MPKPMTAVSISDRAGFTAIRIILTALNEGTGLLFRVIAPHCEPLWLSTLALAISHRVSPNRPARFACFCTFGDFTLGFVS